jgi:hypothetical protein
MQTVKKIEPAQYQTFDQQFWPILVALTVLCGIGIGAILTLLDGPWLWGSLLLLPSLSAAALVILYRLDDSKLRRSLQLSVLVSLAMHLLLLILASLTNVFVTIRKVDTKAETQKVPRSIEISDRRASFVWEEPNRPETPEPIVDVVRRQPPTTDMKPQPVLVQESVDRSLPELVEHETPAETLPRLDRELSELRRQSNSSEPKPIRSSNAAQLTANISAETREHPKPEVAAKARAAPKTNESTESQTPTESAAAEIAVKRSDSQRPTLEKTRPVPSETRPAVQLADSSPLTAPARLMEQISAAQSSRAPALRTSQTPKLVQANPVRRNREAEKKTENETPPVLAAATAELTRRPIPTAELKPSPMKVAQLEQRSVAQSVESALRRQTEIPIPTISSEISNRVEPRRSAVDATVAVSSRPLERPSLPAESDANQATPNPRAESISRSSAGTAGVGKAQNLEAARGGATSPAQRPSDAATRIQAQSQRTELRQLLAAQSPAIRRTAQAVPNPTSALKAEVTMPTNVTGGRISAEQTLESSAARIDGARSENRSRVSVEKGSASVDLGPTKVLPDQSESIRRSGGGQTEVGQLNPDPAMQSRTAGTQQPTLLAKASQVTLAPSTQSSGLASSNLEANSASTLMARSEGDRASTIDRDSAVQAGEASDSGRSQMVAEVANSQARSASEADVRDYADVENQELARRGSQRSGVSAAPKLKGDMGLGGAEKPTGSSLTDSAETSEMPGEALTDISRRVESQVQGLGVSKTTSSAEVDAISLNSADVALAPRRSSQPGVSDIGKIVQEDPAPTDNHRRRDSKFAGKAPRPNLRSASEPTLEAKPVGQEDAKGESLSPSAAEISRDATSGSDRGLELEIVAAEGSPGLGKLPSDSLGSKIRPADKQSLRIQPDSNTRFRKSRFGGKPAINPDAVLANQAYRNRTSSALVMASDPTTEAAIQLGLQFLIRSQNPDGSWSLGNFDQDHPQHAAQLNSDTAATGLALLVFQGAGYNHREYQHAMVVRRGLYWLLEHQQENGCLYLPADKASNDACQLYSHGIATLALTEAYGMTQDPKLKEPCQRAIDYIQQTQDPRKGGWRYFGDPLDSRSTDTSVSGWMMMALHSGRLVGLKVDQKCFAGVNKWLEVAADPDDSSKFRYNPYAVDAEGVSRSQGKRATPAMTSVGLLMRIYGGLTQDDPALVNGAQWLAREHLPSDETPDQRDTYYWYYATQVLKYVDGPVWETWDQRLRPMLIRTQLKSGEQAGSWHPYNPVPDRWGAFGGRLYVTTMNLLSLEVRHRMLPLYKNTNQPEKESQVAK